MYRYIVIGMYTSPLHIHHQGSRKGVSDEEFSGVMEASGLWPLGAYLLSALPRWSEVKALQASKLGDATSSNSSSACDFCSPQASHQ